MPDGDPEPPIQPIEMSQDNLFYDFPVGPPAGALNTLDDFLNEPQGNLPAPSLQSSARLTPLGLSAAQQSQPIEKFPSIGPDQSREARPINLGEESFENTQRNLDLVEEMKENPAEDTYQTPHQSSMLPNHAGDVLKTQE